MNRDLLRARIIDSIERVSLASMHAARNDFISSGGVPQAMTKIINAHCEGFIKSYFLSMLSCRVGKIDEQIRTQEKAVKAAAEILAQRAEEGMK